jgi:hypothetical protein
VGIGFHILGLSLWKTSADIAYLSGDFTVALGAALMVAFAVEPGNYFRRGKTLNRKACALVSGFGAGLVSYLLGARLVNKFACAYLCAFV